MMLSVFRELMTVFPEAKVVLSVRDPKRWYESVRNTIYKGVTFMTGFAGSTFMKLIGGYEFTKISGKTSNLPIDFMDNKGMLDIIEEGEEASIQFFNKWVEEVQKAVPKDKLLVSYFIT